MSESKFEIVQYSTQKNSSLGVSAGMWGVIETSKKAIAYTDTRFEAEQLLLRLRAAEFK